MRTKLCILTAERWNTLSLMCSRHCLNSSLQRGREDLVLACGTWGGVGGGGILQSIFCQSQALPIQMVNRIMQECVTLNPNNHAPFILKHNEVGHTTPKIMEPPACEKSFEIISLASPILQSKGPISVQDLQEVSNVFRKSSLVNEKVLRYLQSTPRFIKTRLKKI